GAAPPPRDGDDKDAALLRAWTAALRSRRMDTRRHSTGEAAILAGELAIGTPYKPNTLEEYIVAGGDPGGREPLIIGLMEFDCVTLVESCLAVARSAKAGGKPSWDLFGHEVERMRYRDGKRGSYASRLHYFSEWISDGERRGLVRNVGRELGGVVDSRPLRFMTEHRSSYRALADDGVFRRIGEMERRLDDRPRFVIPADAISAVADRIESGDVLAFATEIPGLDVSHSAYAYRGPDGVLRVLHAPLSGGVVEITRSTLPEYVAKIRRSAGILVARPLNP
ncbi:MAG: N-acetylmuramoyl-L-alanine amidase-like domain-containing protein, partial [Gemmatimonadaceae bacterium]